LSSSVGSEKDAIITKSIGRINFTINMNAVYFVGGTIQFFIIIIVSSPLKV